MQDKEILFSILVPVYNVEQYIDECIQSVLRQSYSNYELILVDDGSTDKSGAICDQYAEMYAFVKVYHISNQGQFHARKFAIKYATGDYYLALDSDDLLEKNALEVLAKTISAHGCDCVFFNRKRLVEGRIVGAVYHIEEGYVTDRRVLHHKALIEIPYNAIYLKCAKAALFIDDDYSNYYHIQRGEDLLQSLEIYKNCRTAEFIDDELYIYRKRNGSIVNSTNESNWTVDFTVRRLTLEYIENERVFNEQDMNEYRDKCISIFIDQIIKISQLKLPGKEKASLFNEIRNESYYLNFLSKGFTNWSQIGYKAVVYILFKMKLNYSLLALMKIKSRV